MSTTGIERVLQVCLRFIAICRLLHEQEDRDSTVGWSPHTIEPTPTSTHTSVASPSDVLFPTRTGSLRATARDNNTHNHPQRGSVVPVIIPPEEIQGLRKEFFTQVGPISNIKPINALCQRIHHHPPVQSLSLTATIYYLISLLLSLSLITHHSSLLPSIPYSDLVFVSDHEESGEPWIHVSIRFQRLLVHSGQ